MEAKFGVGVEPRTASFIIDGQQRVVQWSFAAAAMTHVPEDVALGKQCYEVVKGHDTSGRPACYENCAAFSALRSGQVIGRSPLLMAGVQREAPRRVTCELVALPRDSGGAVGTLYEARRRSPTPPPASAASRGSADVILRDLAAVTTLSTSLAPENLEQGIDQVLEWVRGITAAEAAELFLAEPQGGDLLLSAYQGPFRKAFTQIMRFHPGQGFPGLVLSGREPILTRDLPSESRYLRTQVKEKGFRSYVCVPLLGYRCVMGALNVASRRPDMDLERALRLLEWAKRPIATALEAGLLRMRERLGGESLLPLPEGEQEFDGVLQAVLQRFMVVGKASGGALLLYDQGVRGPVQRVAAGDFAGLLCPDIRLGNPCPALAGGHGVALYGPRDQWPRPCRGSPAGHGALYCLPLLAGGEAVGGVQLHYATHSPWPATRHLPALLTLAEAVAYPVKQAWTHFQDQQLALGRLSRLEHALGLESVTGQSPRPHSVLPSRAEDLDGGPLLEIRCFGAFELRRQGELVTPGMFHRRQALTLLKILLVQAGRPVPRDVLVELLWPDTDPYTAANRLFVVVHALRQALEPSTQGHAWRYVRSDGDRYYFNLEAPCHLDLREFHNHISLAQQLERKGAVGEAIEVYEAAASLYRGDLLEDEPYAEWCSQERERLRETCLDVVKRLAVSYSQEGALEKSIGQYRRALRIDPLREETHRGLMHALWAAGRRDEALRQYQVCRDILRQELDVAPLPETEELLSRIRRNAPH